MAVRADPLFPQGITGGFDLEAHSLGSKAVVLGHDRLPHIKAVIMEFDHLMAVYAKKVAVAGGIGKIGVILRGLLAQTDLTDQSPADEKGKGAVNRRS